MVPDEVKQANKMHRKCLKQMFDEYGMENFTDVDILDLLLSYSAALSVDTRKTAEQLIKYYGNINTVLDSPAEALCNIPGITEHSAILLTMIPVLMYKKITEKSETTKRITTTAEAVEYLQPYFEFAKKEIFISVYLGKRNNVLKLKKITQGESNFISVNLWNILMDAKNVHADKIIISHNHPSGYCIPSNEDVEMTGKLSELCRTFDIKLCEHIIFNKNSYSLMSQKKKASRKFFTPLG